MQYPPHLRVAIRVDEEYGLPTDVPVGTHCLMGKLARSSFSSMTASGVRSARVRTRRPETTISGTAVF